MFWAFSYCGFPQIFLVLFLFLGEKKRKLPMDVWQVVCKANSRWYNKVTQSWRRRSCHARRWPGSCRVALTDISRCWQTEPEVEPNPEFKTLNKPLTSSPAQFILIRAELKSFIKVNFCLNISLHLVSMTCFPSLSGFGLKSLTSVRLLSFFIRLTQRSLTKNPRRERKKEGTFFIWPEKKKVAR